MQEGEMRMRGREEGNEGKRVKGNTRELENIGK